MQKIIREPTTSLYKAAGSRVQAVRQTKVIGLEALLHKDTGALQTVASTTEGEQL